MVSYAHGWGSWLGLMVGAHGWGSWLGLMVEMFKLGTFFVRRKRHSHHTLIDLVAN